MEVESKSKVGRRRKQLDRALHKKLCAFNRAVTSPVGNAVNDFSWGGIQCDFKPINFEPERLEKSFTALPGGYYFFTVTVRSHTQGCPMPTTRRQITSLVQEFTREVEPGADTDLLTRFARSRDEAAFAALVERHGQMVCGDPF
jgi:hypothetical protein